MNNVNLTIRLEEHTKKEFESFCSNIGMSVTTAFNIFIKQCLREQRIPFEITMRQEVKILSNEELRKISDKIINENIDMYKELAK